MRVLITGVTGFAGSHLAEYILANHPDVSIFATYRWRSRTENLETLTAQDKIEMIEGRYPTGATLRDEGRKCRVTLLHCELTDAGAVEKLISSVQPQRIFHLAAQSYVQSSFDEPSATFRINVESQLNLLRDPRTTRRSHAHRGSRSVDWLVPRTKSDEDTNRSAAVSIRREQKWPSTSRVPLLSPTGCSLVVTPVSPNGPRRAPTFVTAAWHARRVSRGRKARP